MAELPPSNQRLGDAALGQSVIAQRLARFACMLECAEDFSDRDRSELAGFLRRFLPSADLLALNLRDDQDHVALLRDVSWALALDGTPNMGFRVRAAAAVLDRLLRENAQLRLAAETNHATVKAMHREQHP